MQEITLQEAVQLTGKCERTLRSWIKAGKLDAEKANGSYRIDIDELARITPIPDMPGLGGSESEGLSHEPQTHEFALVLQRHEQAIFRLGQLEMENKYLQDNMKLLPPAEQWFTTRSQLDGLNQQLTQVLQEAESLRAQMEQAQTAKRQLEKELARYKGGLIDRLKKIFSPA